jgi:anthranilate/para-aminobenzoate synthase component II
MSGFQAIGQVYGAHIVRAPTPVHGKTSVIQHNGLGIFRNIASPLVAGRYHSLIIERSSLRTVCELMRKVTTI